MVADTRLMELSLLVCLIWVVTLPVVVDSCAATASNSQPGVTPQPNLCGTMCRELAVKRDDPMSQPVTQTAVANAGNRCPGFMEVCRGTSNDSAVIITWYDENGNDVGSTFGTSMAMATLACGPDNKLTFNGTRVNQVECISA